MTKKITKWDGAEKLRLDPKCKTRITTKRAEMMDALTCAKDAYDFLATVKKSDPRSMREVAREAGVNQYTAHTILSGKATTGAALDNVFKLATALGCGVTIHSAPK